MGCPVMSKAKRLQVFAKTGGRCAYCGKELSLHKPWHVDHVNPRANGGNSRLENLMPACSSCNIRKKHRTVEEFRHWIMNGLADDIEIRVVDRLQACSGYLVGEEETSAIEDRLNALYYAIRRQRVRFFFER